MKKTIINSLLATALIMSPISCQKAVKSKPGNDKQAWKSLFNGENLDGWTVKIRGSAVGEDERQTFRVADGVIQVNYENYDRFDGSYGHIFYEKPYSDYKFRMEYRFTGEQIEDGPGWAYRNSGIMFHCQDPETMGQNQEFPVSVEVQLLGGSGEGERTTGNVCTPGTHIQIGTDTITRHCISASSKTFHGDQWVKVEIEVRNDSIVKHFINGDEVLRYFKPHIGGTVDADTAYWQAKAGKPLKKGFIALQSESHPVEFRNIEIFELN